MLYIFEFSHLKENVESRLVYVNKFSRDDKTKFVSASYFLELLWEKNKFQLKQCGIYNHYHLSAL